MTAGLILIVEDNERNSKLLRDVLTAKGYQTHATETAEEGLEYAQEHEPALILMDIALPGMDGVTALRRIRANLAVVIRQGQQAGEIDRGLDPDLAAANLVGLLDGILIQYFVDPEVFPDTRALGASISDGMRRLLIP